MFTGVACMCILLRRLCYPCRYTDMVQTFGCSVGTISLAFNYALNHIYDQYSHLVTNLRIDALRDRLSTFAGAVAAKDAPVVNCAGFIDGTFVECCK